MLSRVDLLRCCPTFEQSQMNNSAENLRDLMFLLVRTWQRFVCWQIICCLLPVIFCRDLTEITAFRIFLSRTVGCFFFFGTAIILEVCFDKFSFWQAFTWKDVLRKMGHWLLTLIACSDCSARRDVLNKYWWFGICKKMFLLERNEFRHSF